MAGANPGQALQIALRRYQHARGAGHRLDDHGGDGVGAMQADQAFEMVRKSGAISGLAFGKGVTLKIVSVRQMIDPRKHRAKGSPVIGDAAYRHAAETYAVIAAFAPDEARPLPLASRAVIGKRDLKRGVHGLGP